jgi:hypothetical protein
MEVEKPAAPERFRYCDLKEAFMARSPYGDSIGCVTRTREARRAEQAISAGECLGQSLGTGSCKLVCQPSTLMVLVWADDDVSTTGVALSCGCHQVSVRRRAKAELRRCEAFQ